MSEQTTSEPALKEVYTVYECLSGWVLKRGWDGQLLAVEEAEDVLAIIGNYICYKG